MIQIILFVVALNLIIFVLPVMWKNTFLDHYRDQLFDLREDVRAFFLQNDLGLQHPIYKKLRNLLNQHIRFLEDVTFLRVVSRARLLVKNKKLREHLIHRVEKTFSSDDPELNKYSEKVRCEAIDILALYIVQSNMLLFFLVNVIARYSYLKSRLTAISVSIKEKVSIASHHLLKSLATDGISLEELSYFSEDYHHSEKKKQQQMNQCSQPT